MQSATYTCLDYFIYRAPLLPVNFHDYGFINSDIFREALYIASPDLYDALVKDQQVPFEMLPEKTRLSLLKYFIRMRYRSTPFGLFAGCGVGTTGETAGITINGTTDFRSSTRLDMTFLCALSEAIALSDEIRDGLVFYPNNSLYRAGETYRYVEHKYRKGERKYFLSELEAEEMLDMILDRCKEGARFPDILALLQAEDIPHEDALEYITDLIHSQVLISNLYPGVTGTRELLYRMLETLKGLGPSQQGRVAFLEEIRNRLRTIDQTQLGRSVQQYSDIETMIRQTRIDYNRKHLFQADLAIDSQDAHIDRHLQEAAMDGFYALNKITPKSGSNILKQFKEDFYRRYEEAEIPLTEVLDPDLGIGFGKLKPGNVSINPFAEGLEVLNGGNDYGTTGAADYFDKLMLKKYHAYLQHPSPHIELLEEEIKTFPNEMEDLPDTLNAIIEVAAAGEDGPPLIYMPAATGSSAANLLGRFCHIHEGIRGIAEDIVRIEDEQLHDHEILAEIVHLPQSRTGNILYRPVLRKYEIPYLSAHQVDDAHKILITDLLVTVKNGRILLRSAKLNKYVWPRLTTAHNFMGDSLPVYKFLATLQRDGGRNSLYFAWPSAISRSKFLPRVIYKQVILSYAEWHLPPEDTRQLPAADSADFDTALAAFREQHRIPDQVFIVQGDNRLLIDFRETYGPRLFVAEVKGKQVKLEEMVFDETRPLIRNGNEIYSNELVLFFRRNGKRTPLFNGEILQQHATV